MKDRWRGDADINPIPKERTNARSGTSSTEDRVEDKTTSAK